MTSEEELNQVAGQVTSRPEVELVRAVSRVAFESGRMGLLSCKSQVL